VTEFQGRIRHDGQDLDAAFQDFFTATAKYFEGIFHRDADIERICREFMSLDRAREQLALVNNATPGGLAGKRALEIGSGCGAQLLSAAHDFGAIPAGVEPGGDDFPANINLARAFFKHHGEPVCLCDAVGEELPFRDNAFDVVFSFNVLEHVQDPGRVLAETVRTLKPGGTGFILVPNYGSFWEGHYGIFWIPHMPHFLARLYVRLFKRSPAYLDTLHFVTVGGLKRWLKPHGRNIEILDWGYGIWAERLRSEQFSEWAELGRLKRMVRVAKRMGLTPALLALGKLFHWQTPIILVFRKKPSG
jgi:SAM-dependent methyltransferase